MAMERLSAERLTQKARTITKQVSAAIERETGETYDQRLIEDSIRKSIANMFEGIEDDMDEMFSAPERREFQELIRLLERRTRESADLPIQVTQSVPDAVFAGNRPFSKEKLSAMIEYLTGKGRNVYKTSLNKLLFYSDLSYFYLRNQGMSGAVYYNRPFGPVAEPAGELLDELIQAGHVKIIPRTRTLEAAVPAGASAILTAEEKTVLDWITETYGSMTASAISELSHEEKAYRFTAANEPIAYAYAKFLNKLPPADLIEDES